MSKQVIAYRISAEGIFGRKRNPSRQSHTFGYSEPEGTFIQSEFEAALAEFKATSKPKAGVIWRLLAVPVEENRYPAPDEPNGEVVYHMEALFNVGIVCLLQGTF